VVRTLAGQLYMTTFSPSAAFSRELPAIDQLVRNDSENSWRAVRIVLTASTVSNRGGHSGGNVIAGDSWSDSWQAHLRAGSIAPKTLLVDTRRTYQTSSVNEPRGGAGCDGRLGGDDDPEVSPVLATLLEL